MNQQRHIMFVCGCSERLNHLDGGCRQIAEWAEARFIEGLYANCAVLRDSIGHRRRRMISRVDIFWNSVRLPLVV